MKPKVHNFLQMFRRSILYILVLCSPKLAMAQELITLNAANADHPYDFNVGAPIMPVKTIKQSGAANQVRWEFKGGFPGGSTAIPGDLGFIKDGVSVKLPAAENALVDNNLSVEVSGTPTPSLSAWTFTLLVTEEGTGVQGERKFTVNIKQPLDLVLVLDRSGSMDIAVSSDPGAPSRWKVLQDAVANFALLYQTINPANRLGVTYFATDAAPASTCCGTLQSADLTLAGKVNTDLNLGPVQPVPAGMTAMGKGLKDATAKLSDATRARSILLFTDGEQNQSPQVKEDGTGYTDGTNIPGGPNVGGIKISTIGIGSPSGKFHTTLLGLATANRGSYVTTLDGLAFSQQGGLPAGDLSMGFTVQFVNMLSAFSPQIVTTAFKPLPPSGTVDVATFPLNKNVDKLLLEFNFGRKLEVYGLYQLISKLKITKDGVNVKGYGKPTWVSNYSNTVLVTFDFNQSPNTAALSTPLTPEGIWNVQAADSNMNVRSVNLNVLADDHRINWKRTLGNLRPKVKDKLPISFELDWLQHPVTGADVKVLMMSPDKDLGNVMSINDLVAKLNSNDPASPGVQKYNKLWEDSAFRAQFKLNENVVQLNHTSGGKYEGTFDGLNVAGIYKLIYLVKVKNDSLGEVVRTHMESIYVSFAGVDLAQSDITTQVTDGKLVMNIRPKTPYGMWVGPAMGDVFAVSNPGIKIDSVTDHQDGRYTIVFSGAVAEPTKLVLLGQEIYDGKLENAGKSGGFWEKIKQWLESLGLPAWSIWILLLLILFLLWLIFRKKK